MDAPRPNTSTPAFEHRTEYLWKLSCGCVLKHSVRSKNRGTAEEETSAFINDEDAIKRAEFDHGVLSFWFRDRQPRHQCALVSAENPNGIGPRAKKSEDVPA